MTIQTKPTNKNGYDSRDQLNGFLGHMTDFGDI